MWFEILPAAGAIFTCMTIGFYATDFFPYLGWGKPFFRKLTENSLSQAFYRDERLTGSAFKLQGLEVIPDAEDAKKK